MKRHTLSRLLVILLAALTLPALSGCAANQPTPALVDPSGFATYTHPTGVFSIDLPPDWVVSDTSDNRAVRVEFSPPGSAEPWITVYVINSAVLNPTAILDPENASSPAGYDFDTLVATYQTLSYNRAGSVFKELAREPQPDGSLRLTIVEDAPGGAVQYNDFSQPVGVYFSALRVRLPDDPAQVRALNRIVNTFRVAPDAGWMSDVAVSMEQSSARADTIGFSGLNAWLNASGGYEIAGQIANNSPGALEFARVTVQFFDSEGRMIADRDDFVPSDLILPGEYVPFSIVFPDGLPAGAVRYDISASARYADFNLRTFYGPENLAVTSAAEFAESGLLVISGQVRNEGTQTAELVKVIVTVFDDQQRVVGTATTLVDRQTLAPGETSPYAVSFVELGGTPATFQVSAQGVLADEG
ncbi:MAG: hypothetical protein Kow00124_15860 [Anaerolineae bacterium]